MLGEDPDYSDFANTFPGKHPNIGWFNDSAIMQEYSGLEQSLQAWRFRHHVYNDVCQKQQNAAKLKPLSSNLAAPPTAATVTKFPQHSISENIFRKSVITLQVFDVGGDIGGGTFDGDVVDVYFNDRRILANLLLTPYPGRTLKLTLQPSDLLPKKTNRGMNTGGFLSFTASCWGKCYTGIGWHNFST